MGRTIIAEENLKQTIDELFQNCKWQIGLIIGQLSSKRDFILHLAKCPDPVEDEAEIESCQEDDVVTPKKGDKKPKSASPSSGEEINSIWITEHARQVNRMLPGGLNIIGMFIFCSPEFATKNQSKLRNCINEVSKVTEKNKYIKNAAVHLERIFLHISSSTRKTTCRTVDLSDAVTTFQPAEMKYQSFINTWNSVRSILNVNVHFHIPVSSEKSRLETQILQGFQAELRKIWESTAVINGRITHGDEPLFEPAKSGKGKERKENRKTSDVELYSSQNTGRTDKLTKHTSLRTVSFIGKIFSQAYLHAKATKDEAIKALKADAIRSLLSRLQLLCEEAEVNNLYQVENWSLLSPTRVFLPLNKSVVGFCDYIFKDEQNLDSIQRFSELLGLQESEESMLFLEKAPDNDAVAKMSFDDQASSSVGKMPEKLEISDFTERNNIYACLIGVILAVIAVVVGLVSLK